MKIWLLQKKSVSLRRNWIFMRSRVYRLVIFVWAFVMVAFFFLFELNAIQKDDVFIIAVFLIACAVMMHFGIDHTYDDEMTKKEPPER